MRTGFVAFFKKYGVAICGLGFIGLLAWFLGSGEQPVTPEPAPILETKEASVSLYYPNGRINWVINSPRFIVRKGDQILNAAHISKGEVWDEQGSLVLSHMSALDMRIFSVEKRVEGRNFSANYWANSSSAVDRKPIRINAGEFTCDSKSNRADLSHFVCFVKGKMQICANNDVEVSVKDRIVSFKHNVEIKSPTLNIYAKSMVLEKQDHAILLDVKIKTWPQKKSKTPFSDPLLSVSCDTLTYSKQMQNTLLILDGHVSGRDETKTFVSKSGQFEPAKKKYELNNAVRIDTKNLKWILSEAEINKIKVSKWHDLIVSNTIIFADKSITNLNEKKWALIGHVEIRQAKYKLTADRLDYFGKTKQIVLSGNVNFKENNRVSFQAKAATVNVEELALDATQKIRTIFYKKRS